MKEEDSRRKEKLLKRTDLTTYLNILHQIFLNLNEWLMNFPLRKGFEMKWIKYTTTSYRSCIIVEVRFLFGLHLSDTLNVVFVVQESASSSQGVHTGFDAYGFQLSAVEILCWSCCNYFKIYPVQRSLLLCAPSFVSGSSKFELLNLHLEVGIQSFCPIFLISSEQDPKRQACLLRKSP